ncbi:unnamed protein product [Candida verbasci]|uniref:Potassium transport protein n=1 Tax=Candida verbasci TaxID=1227364 RepID=A0A9W4TSF9_9ASCO|nr:unnamed protein product [Candida verbasci]
MNKISELYNHYKRNRFHIEFGFHVRNFIHDVASKVYPIAKLILPNFRAVHYFYVITLVFLGSILVYPVKSVPYIDVLFFTSGASTQAGLNTVDLNNISLYQQIILYLITGLTTPIFIHGSLLFIRLYYFERHFDNIKEKSKLDFKMRRNATLARQRSSVSGVGSVGANSTRMNTYTNQGLGFYDDDQEKEIESTSPQSSSINNNNYKSHNNNNNNNNVEHYSEPSDDEENDYNREKKHTISDSAPATSTSEGIKFGVLPHPRRRKSIDPEDMYRSINMLQEKQKDKESTKGIQFFNISSPSKMRRSSTANTKNSNTSHKDDDNDDDVLVIKSPKEIENSTDGHNNTIFIKKKMINLPKGSQIHFVDNPLRRKKWLTSTGGTTTRKHYNPWASKLRKTLSNSGRRRFSSISPSEEEENDNNEEEEDDASIDSEDNNLTQTEDEHEVDDEDDEEEQDDDEQDDDEQDEDDEEDKKDNENAVDDEEEDTSLKRAQSNLVLPSKDETSGKKYTKRSNTMDVTSDPIIDEDIIRRRKKVNNKPKKKKSSKFNIKRIKTPGLSSTANSIQEGSIQNYNTNDLQSIKTQETNTDLNRLSKTMSGNYLSWTPTVGRNSTFIKLTEAQKEELGGIEYRAVKLLIKIIVIYYIGFHMISAIMLTIWIYCMPYYRNLMSSQGIVPAWWAFFTAQSSFNDLGLTLTANSMSSFNQNAFVQILTSFLIVIGNTGFPIFLRFVIWIMFKTARPLSLYKESLGFLLDHPRRCFTLLFPSVPTWWLFFVLVVLNGFDLVIFCILDLKNKSLDGIPTGYKVLNGLYQAFCTRTVGFSIMDLSQLHAATQVSYMLMMYISVLPIAISVRRTNVYEEQSLGVYAKDENGENEENGVDESKPTNYIGAHLRNQLSFDLWFIFLGLFIICIAEGKKLQKQEFRFSVFAILFEIISAYGTVGMSLGYPDVNTSLSGKFNVISKLVIIAMMIRGRHRGLPYTIDRAIMLPDADMRKHDRLQEHHAANRQQSMERTNTLGRAATTMNNLSGPIDGNDNIVTRILTNVGNFRQRQKEKREAEMHSEDPKYVITSVSNI